MGVEGGDLSAGDRGCGERISSSCSSTSRHESARLVSSGERAELPGRSSSTPISPIERGVTASGSRSETASEMAFGLPWSARSAGWRCAET